MINLSRGTILGAFILFVFFYSCTKDEMLKSKGIEPEVTSLKAQGENQIDVLGYGYDVTGEYLDPLRSKKQIIDIERIMAERPNSVCDAHPGYSKTFITEGADALVFTSKLSRVVKENLKAVFSGQISSDNSKEVNSKYSYAFANRYIYLKNIRFEVLEDKLAQYLTKEFTDDLNSLTPELLVKLYGTHVFTNVFLGGKCHLTYKSVVKSEKKEEAITYGASAALKNVFGIVSGYKENTTLENSNTDVSVVYFTKGGNKSMGIEGTYTTGTPVTFNLNNWSSTVNESNMELIDVGDESLIPLYDFIQDPTKKEFIKSYIENYIDSKKLFLVNEFNRYNSNILTDFKIPAKFIYKPWFYYSTGGYHNVPVFTPKGYDGLSIRTEGLILPLSSDKQGSVPLYRFMSKNGSYFYTTERDELKQGRVGFLNYNYQREEGRVFLNQIESTIPLYRYSRVDFFKLDNLPKPFMIFYYTTDFNELGNGTSVWNFDKIQCYIYKNK